jgi:hypothetical protein
MTPEIHIKAKVTPWDDTAFVHAFETARHQVHASGVRDSVQAGAEVQRRLRDAGYPDARVEVARSVSEALEHTSHWVVSRDG